ncbi:hypothetical protein PTTG_27364 [Puccinia triticina 1-1 BBBD Race 1]|uniref:DUF659 domain-containing protein n=1 Tax=Puccinia triticina (isolate 1-1 / race 1 (BBBD)) TaxID=630390 RepID=A0A180GKI7_PUCT1|nr:hypothetical protein PTTG_27364 [Puccinia triticina 1-1 BBBD Race 1]
MANISRKRRKPPGSPPQSLSPGISSQSQNHPHQKQRSSKTIIVDDSDEEQLGTNGSKSQGLTDEQELARALRVHNNQLSSCYASYNPPQLSNQLDKNNRKMISYSCKMCGSTIHRPIHDTSPSNLLKHVASCLKKQQEHKSEKKLAAVGVSGTGDIDPREVPQLCAIWKAVSCDIGRLYTAVQDSFIKQLEKHKGALYLGLDAWQSPNGFDILGTVIYRLVKDDTGSYEFKAMPLDSVLLKDSHTGFYLADTICGIVTDNASNNQKMIEEIRKLKWPRIKGEAQWIQCFAHIMNLIVQVILRPFGSYKKNKMNNCLSINDESDEDDKEEADEQIKRFSIDEWDAEDEDEPGDECQSPINDSMLAGELIDDEEIELETSDVNELSDEDDDDDVYTSQSCGKTLSKFRAIARKLKKSPNSKAIFVQFCQEKECLKPHNIERDVRTRWNSTLMQLNGILRCSEAIMEWQKDKRYGNPREHQISHSDLKLAQDLVEVLQPFHKITLQVSTRGSAWISQVVVFIDQITSHLLTAISNKSDGYPPALQNACRAGLQLTNKYYTLTDCSPLYRVAMVLHPSFKDKYFKLAKWQPDWIDESIRLTREMWETHYKPTVQPILSQEPSIPHKPPTGVLARLSSASQARSANTITDPLSIWLAGGLHLHEGSPVDPLKWWI